MQKLLKLKRLKWMLLGAVVLFFAGALFVLNLQSGGNGGDGGVYIPASSIKRLNDIHEFLKMVSMEEVIVTGITGKKELVVMEADVEETVKIDKSWMDWSVFRKTQTVKYTGRGVYTADLEENISVVIDHDNKQVIVTAGAPSLKYIEILEDKTLFRETEKGIFRFGNITLTLEESNALMEEVKRGMQEKLLEGEMVEAARNHTERSVREIVEEIMNKNAVSYTVSVHVAE